MTGLKADEKPYPPPPGGPPQPPQAGRLSPRPPPYNRAPPSGFRIPLTSSSPFPNQAQLLAPPCNDSDGSPVYVGSALFPTSVHPCKIVPRFRDTACRVPYGGQEVEHRGRYDLLPITADMEWVKTSGGKVPYGRRAVEGGYEEDGKKLYHAMILIEGVRVPGKAGEHLGGAHSAWGGQEMYLKDHEILCWRD